MLEKQLIEIYTDGSCHTQLLVGAWAALIFINGKKQILKGIQTDTTHNRMELLAVIKAIELIDNNGLKEEELNIYSDSQYVVNLNSRREKLEAKNFISSKGTVIQNADLVQILLLQIATHHINFVKVKAHQKPNGTQNFNREVDKIVRNLVRENVIKNG
ncbi:MAG: ribonuclease HI [Bacteroidetes bacterium]|nr:ribonuclease HI [Bacteroidota bacterium]